jgi:competence protein ComFC
MERSDATLDLIHRLKYGRELHLGGDLGKLACGAFSDRRLAIAMDEKWPLVPVPLHRSRQMERQFNQAEEIARSIGIETGLPVMPLLKRVRRTETQTRLSRNQRMENLKGAFALRKTACGVPPQIILVDDVFTTGSTVDECAKVLRKAGAGRIAVLTVMRG